MQDLTAICRMNSRQFRPLSERRPCSDVRMPARLDGGEVQDLGLPPAQLLLVLPLPLVALAQDGQLRLGAQARAARVVRQVAEAAEHVQAPAGGADGLS